MLEFKDMDITKRIQNLILNESSVNYYNLKWKNLESYNRHIMDDFKDVRGIFKWALAPNGTNVYFYIHTDKNNLQKIKDDVKKFNRGKDDTSDQYKIVKVVEKKDKIDVFLYFHEFETMTAV